MEKEKEKLEKKPEEKTSKACKDKLCPQHGLKPLKVRGRTFEGIVIKKLPGRVTIEQQRMFYVRKYERYEKRKTKLHARLPGCIGKDIVVGDYIEIGECRPVSKTIHFVVIKKVRGKK